MAQTTDEQRGIKIGFCMAAAILVRDFDQPTMAQELLGAAGIEAADMLLLDLDEYDTNALSKLLID